MEQQPSQQSPNRRRFPAWWHAARSGLIVVALVAVYAFGFQVTQINLETPKEPRRQMQLANIMRGLANPRLLEYTEERVQVEAPVLIPCDPLRQLPAG